MFAVFAHIVVSIKRVLVWDRLWRLLRCMDIATATSNIAIRFLAVFFVASKVFAATAIFASSDTAVIGVDGRGRERGTQDCKIIQIDNVFLSVDGFYNPNPIYDFRELAKRIMEPSNKSTPIHKSTIAERFRELDGIMSEQLDLFVLRPMKSSISAEDKARYRDLLAGKHKLLGVALAGLENRSLVTIFQRYDVDPNGKLRSRRLAKTENAIEFLGESEFVYVSYVEAIAQYNAVGPEKATEWALERLTSLDRNVVHPFAIVRVNRGGLKWINPGVCKE